jgi:hypothetical protein
MTSAPAEKTINTCGPEIGSARFTATEQGALAR